MRLFFVARRWVRLAWALVLLLLAAPLSLAAPRQELLRLVPDSIGFCLVLHDLRAHAASLHPSPFADQLRQSPFFAHIRDSADVKKLHRLEAVLKEKIGLDWAHLRDDILGDTVAFAYRPGPPGKSEQERGLILLRARNAKALSDLIERFNKLQKDEGDLQALEERRHHDVVYHRRLERGKPPTFYYVHGPILALCDREDMLQEAIDCDRTRGSDAVSEAERRLRELGAERALLSVWINPRAFDAAMLSKAAGESAERAGPAKQIAIYWKALENIVFSLVLAEREVNLALAVRARVEELPVGARRFFAAAAVPSELWRRFPQEALLAVAGRLDAAALFEVLSGFLPPEGRQALQTNLSSQVGALLGEEDFAKNVLPSLGPDGGLCLLAPAASDKGWIPHALVALRVGSTQRKKPLDQELMEALDFAARLLVFAHNSQHPDRPLTLKTTEADKPKIHYVSGERGLPLGMQPAYAVRNGYLVLASSLDGLGRFASAASTAPAAKAEVPLVRISVQQWRDYLKERREPIVRFLAEKNELSREAAEKHLDEICSALQFVDRLELRHRSAPGQVVLTLSARTARALRK